MVWDILQPKLVGKKAPDISGDVWFNETAFPDIARARIKIKKPIRFPNELAGNVVLVDFWDYSCINCVNTLPYLTQWWSRYKKKNFLIIGVHTPEFDFGKDEENVRSAIIRFHLTYPVVSDSNYATWDRYQNNVWPRKFLIDAHGIIQYDRRGEGGYEEMEKEIQRLLKDLDPQAIFKKPIVSTIAGGVQGKVCKPATPEIYLGWQRGHSANRGEVIPDRVSAYTLPSQLQLHTWALCGHWVIQADSAEHSERDFQGADTLVLRYSAQQVFAVMRTQGGTGARIEVQQDGKPITKAIAGEDIVFVERKSFVSVNADRLYKIVSNRAHEEHTLVLVPGTEQFAIHTFTFSGECG